MPSENKPAIAQGQKSKPEPAIVVSHVSMLFKRAKDEATSVKELLVRAVRGQNHYEMFKALDDINLTIQKGEVVGIIGTNGSGKSTLLKIISGALIPTRGKVLVDRKSVQLLTLGTGFDPELTGRENVYLNGAIIGYPKSFIDQKYRAIVQFAELEGFMEEKVRNYSSGMVSRLGFAIATIRDTPEILILDDSTSAVDTATEAAIRESFKNELKDTTRIIIAQRISSVQDADRILVLDDGKIIGSGTHEELLRTCRAYEEIYVTQTGENRAEEAEA